MPAASQSHALSRLPQWLAGRLVWAAVLGVGCVLLALVGYWAVQLHSFDEQRDYTEAQSWVRITQVSQAVAIQVQTLLAGLNYSMRALQSQYETGDFADFERQVQATLEAYPHGALLQVAVADAAGSIIYSNLTPKSTPKSTTEGTAPQPTVSIADREHFQVHQLGRETGLFVSKPVQGKISHQWTLQLTRALRPQGQFAGVSLPGSWCCRSRRTSSPAIFAT